jgi:predicted component of type VI protein secretion system
LSGYLQMSDGRIAAVRHGLVLGRVAASDVMVDDPKASRRHARVVVEGGVVEIEDLQSSNGTLLNGHPVTRRVMRDGDRIRIGTTEIVYREGAVPGVPSETAAPAVAAAADDDDLFADSAPAAPEPAPPPQPRPERAAPAPASPRGVVEFADEVVEVRQPAKQPAKAGPAAGEPVVRSQRILQYSNHGGGTGLLGDDLSQMSSGTRALVSVLVLLLAAGIVWGVIWLVR